VLTLLNQVIAPLQTYMHARLIHALTLLLRTRVYQKINGLQGLVYFADPCFHDIIQVAANNAQIGPLQALSLFTTVLQSGMTLLSFLGVLLTLSPLLTAIVGLAAIPRMLAQMKASQQRFITVPGTTARSRRTSYYDQVLSWLTHAKEVRLFRLGDYVLQKFVSTTREIHDAQDRQQRRELRWQSALALLASLVSTGAFVFVIREAFAGQLSLGEVALYTSAVISTAAARSTIAGALAQLNDSLLFFRQYTRLQTLQETLVPPPQPRPVPRWPVGFLCITFPFAITRSSPGSSATSRCPAPPPVASRLSGSMELGRRRWSNF
jgi:ATP-binding cassette subfamily B protein